MSSAQLLTLKVLRTTRPSITNDEDNTLILPSSFGTIYEGERFDGLFSLRIDQPNAIAINPRLIVEIQSPITLSKSVIGAIDTLKLSSLDSSADHENEDRSIKQALELVINHRILELGLHSLICTVTYEEPHDLSDYQNVEQADLPPHLQQNHLRSFRKLYKFQVLNPVSIKSKIYHRNQNQNSHPSSVGNQRLQVLDNWKQILSDLKVDLPSLSLEEGDAENYFKSIQSKSTDSLDSSDLGFGGFYLEIQVQNLSSKTFQDMKLEINFGNEDNDKEEELIVEIQEIMKTNRLDRKNESKLRQLEGSNNTEILPGDIRQYTFEIKTKNQQIKEASKMKDVIELGIEWKSMMGESGRIIRTIKNPLIQTSHHQQQDSTSNESITNLEYLSNDHKMIQQGGKEPIHRENQLFRWEILGFRRTVCVGKPFQVSLKLTIKSPENESEDNQFSKRLNKLLLEHLSSSLRVIEVDPSLLLLTSLPLTPSFQTTTMNPKNQELIFKLDYIPITLPSPNPTSSFISLGNLSTDTSSLDSLLGLSSAHHQRQDHHLLGSVSVVSTTL
ncbi:hypothetical protein PSTG_06821 [Puccinia striiformis f. sp. tritici PST-78]|uniref:Uncharacterized protein n=1 Tax=Puccinia striiformis f. sp. tritici PST-78 TaxID=1165861 RepID=A0A0L0VLW7_9BASI|nr:hypothetical protein PSTG_06821 [Puccinia striiformis f. sp. tritici PST-78]